MRHGGDEVTHTFALMEVSPATYNEVMAKLKAAGYDDTMVNDALDMHGIALTCGAVPNQSKSQRTNPKSATRED